MRYTLPLLALLLFHPTALRAADPKAGPLDVELDSLRPGLAAEYRSLLDKEAVLTRIDAKPAFTLGHSSPHPRIPPGSFEVTWNGVLFFKETPPVRFDAIVCGEMSVEVDGVVVLEGKGDRETSHIVSKQPLQRDIGLYRLKIRYRSLPELPARLQIGWEGPSFSHEPLPPWQLKHLAADLPKTMVQDQLADQGRHAVGKLGCARCHASAFPGVNDPPPGPSLADIGRRVKREWLLDWLDQPDKLRPGARMPALFAADRKGFVERWLITDLLLRGGEKTPPREVGDHRAGRLAFLTAGCTACHFLPDVERSEQADLDRHPHVGLADRLPAEDLAAFLTNPPTRYPDGRMPRLPLTPDAARNIAAYLHLWSKPAAVNAAGPPPTADEINAVARRLGVRGADATANALIREKGCLQCHPGVGPSTPTDIAIKQADDSKGCLSAKGTPHFTVDASTAKSIVAYRTIAASEKHPSPFAARQLLLDRAGCVRCHQRDSDRPPPLEVAGSTIAGAYLQNVPFQRTPKLTYPHQKYLRPHLVSVVREGVQGLRPSRYSYRMPAFGEHAEALVQALAEADGELPASPEPVVAPPADPTLATLSGASLAGFAGYSCVSCHPWNGQMLSEPDPGAVATDLTRLKGRIRRDWFDRFLEEPARAHPGTPMPAVFQKGKPATLNGILDGDPARQKEAMWSYFMLGKDAPAPKPPPPLPVLVSADGPVVAQIPLRPPQSPTAIEAIAILYPSHDLIVWDVGTASLHSCYSGAQILRNVQARLRHYAITGTPCSPGANAAGAPMQLLGGDKPETPEITLHGYDRLADGVRIRWQARFPSGTIEVAETLRMKERRLVRELSFSDVPAGKTLEIKNRVPESSAVEVEGAKANQAKDLLQVVVTPDAKRTAAALIRYPLPPAQTPPVIERTPLADAGKPEGSLERPGYRAIAYPRPKTAAGDDLVMPGAVAVNPKDGRVFVASMKLGEIFVVNDPSGDGKSARFDNYAHGLFQETYSMLAEDDALYVLHRRNLTRITESNGVASRFDRLVALPHGIADTYDYGYGLVRDKTGAFVFSFAPYANRSLPGSGGAVRLVGDKFQEVAYGFRNPVGWCVGPEKEIFFTDNQGEWVATNKLCHIVDGKYYGFPNSEQKQHAQKPMAKTTIWVPYGWAHSINGVTYDGTGGKFGPFAGQIFMAELMFGGAIVRANLEQVNGQYQGACFPFWGRGLLGPLTLAFDPKGRLWVGSITEPGWMAQPDRGALYRIDFTGQTPFEMQSIHVRPKGFRIVFTQPVSPDTARQLASYQLEHYRYEYTGAYGSPELDRTRLPIEKIELSADGKSVDLTTGPLVKDRVYLIQPKGVRSAQGEPLVHPLGAYTLNEIPAR